jgi:hypothetical protein
MTSVIAVNELHRDRAAVLTCAQHCGRGNKTRAWTPAGTLARERASQNGAEASIAESALALAPSTLKNLHTGSVAGAPLPASATEIWASRRLAHHWLSYCCRSMGDNHTTKPGPKLLDRVATELRTRHRSRRTEDAYVGWIRRFILFHRKRHPTEMGPTEISAFLSHLAVQQHVSASTQNQALCALLFLYNEGLRQPVGTLDGIVRARRPVKVPVVLTRDEVRAVLAQLHGTSWLVGSLLYGAGLRLLEALNLRVKDVDLDRRQIVVRRGKGQKDRITVLAEAIRPQLIDHLRHVPHLHERDVVSGFGSAPLP